MMTQQKNISNGVPPPRWVLKIFTKINVIVYKLSGGRLMDKLSGMPILLVEMKGVRSGKKRTIPLMCVPHGDGFLLVASQGGAPKHPVWHHNLVAYPDVRITFGGQTRSMNARRLLDEEKAQLWPVCCKHYPPYQNYQARTDRNIPVFLCE
jgi:deazaflavin-dependent oxidoreductase (nitroreductase family)|tara:strand:+ start:223 stop:675 length:453 start_codon:yes stop_codon:yes gene_type:complete